MRSSLLQMARLLRVGLCGTAAAALLLPAPGWTQAQQQKGAPKPAIAVQGPAMPGPYKLNMMIRTTLIALSQANLTGNYSVLRDLGSPEFQAINSSARLAESFTELRRRKLDFSPILFFNPKLVRQPSFDEAGRLRLTGYIETRPEQINFDMLFADVSGEWRLFGLAVEMQPVAAKTAAAEEQTGAAPPASSVPAKEQTGSAPAKDKRTSEKPVSPSKLGANTGWTPTTSAAPPAGKSK